MKSIRLLPVVIFAALALLVFKGIGLVSNGFYVLTGPAVVVAEEGAAPSAAEATMPSDAVIADTSPTMSDTAPTMPTKPEAAAADHGGSAEASSGAEASGSGEHAAAPSEAAAATVACPETGAPAAAAADHGAPADAALTDTIGTALAVGCPSVEQPTNQTGDALPTIKDANGKIVPLAVAEGDDSGPALLQRLTERRGELDKREADLAMRTDLLAAAEKRLDERTKALEALQAQVNALVDEKQAAEDAGFKGVVSMYETMKPKEAAKVFDQLELPVLLRVVRAMNPRKMSPVLAAMSANKADQLTTALAAVNVSATVADGGENLAALPQIVGK